MKHLHSTTALFFAISCVTGISIALAIYGFAQVHATRQVLQKSEAATFLRTIQIDNYDPAQHTLRATLVGLPIGNITSIVLTIGAATVITTQRGVIDNGAIVRLTAPLPAQTTDLITGRSALAAFAIQENGSLFALKLILDTPMVAE